MRTVLDAVILVTLARFTTCHFNNSEITDLDSDTVSGWNAAEGQFPYVISLKIPDIPQQSFLFCEGSIIHKKWGLTAASCLVVNGISPPYVIVRAGSVRLFNALRMFVVRKYYTHPHFNLSDETIQPNDIALLYFIKQLQFGDTIQRIRLQTSADMNRNYKDEQLIVSGWGRTWTKTKGVDDNPLRWVYVSEISNDDCLTKLSLLSMFGDIDFIETSTLCVVYNNSLISQSHSPCQGDTGGPLIISDSEGQVTQVGVSSFTVIDCHSGFPAGYIRPGHYHDWFKEVTGIDFDRKKTTSKTETRRTLPGLT